MLASKRSVNKRKRVEQESIRQEEHKANRLAKARKIKADALVKWRAISQGRPIPEYLNKYRYKCSFCEYTYPCSNCPARHSCMVLLSKWTIRKTKENAMAVLHSIADIDVERIRHALVGTVKK